ncbi:MAG: glycerol kinase GlpK [Anaerolineales bacterium]
MPDFVAAIDQGTTSTRCMIFDHNGGVVASAQEEHRQIYPRPGWVEHDPSEIWERTRQVTARCLRDSGLDASDLVAVGVTNQRETTIVWDRETGRPLYNAIVWQDTRTEAICRQLAEAGGTDRFRSTTGLPLTTYSSGPKLKWILDNVPGIREGAEQGRYLFGNVDTWLVWNLTGEHVTDATNASRTLMMDIKQLAWDEGILQVLGVPPRMLPAIASSTEVLGTVRSGADAPLEGLPIAGDLGDQQAALFGQTCFGVGDAKSTYGTGCFVLQNTGTQPVFSHAGLLTTVAYALDHSHPVYALEGSIAVAGALVQWLRDNLGLIQQSAEVENLARTVQDNGGVYFVPAFSGLFAPYWRSDARGAIMGMTAFTNKGHIARAALEATAFQTREVLDAMASDSQAGLASLKVDGGMVVNDLLMQFQADLLGVPVVRPSVAETTALGAAYAAGLAVGFWKSLDELRAHWRVDKTWEPRMDAARREELYAIWKRAVQRTLGWLV